MTPYGDKVLVTKGSSNDLSPVRCQAIPCRIGYQFNSRNGYAAQLGFQNWNWKSPDSQLFFSLAVSSHTTYIRFFRSNNSQIWLCVFVWWWWYYKKNWISEILGVCYWYVKMPRCGCVEHGLEYITFYVQKHIRVVPLTAFGPPTFVKLPYWNWWNWKYWNWNCKLHEWNWNFKTVTAEMSLGSGLTVLLFATKVLGTCTWLKKCLVYSVCNLRHQ